MLVFMRQPLVSLVPRVVELDADVFNFSLNFFAFLYMYNKGNNKALQNFCTD